MWISRHCWLAVACALIGQTTACDLAASYRAKNAELESTRADLENACSELAGDKASFREEVDSEPGVYPGASIPKEVYVQLHCTIDQCRVSREPA